MRRLSPSFSVHGRRRPRVPISYLSPITSSPLSSHKQQINSWAAFDAAAIAALKSRSGSERPTQVEVVLAILCRCFTPVSLANDNIFSAVTQSVDLQQRAHPPLPSESFEKFQDLTVAACVNDGATDLGELVSKIRDSLCKIDGNYINNFSRSSGGGGVSVYSENRGRLWSGIPQGVDFFYISSWCDLGVIDDGNFGWGKPIRVDAYSEGSVSVGGIVSIFEFIHGPSLLSLSAVSKAISSLKIDSIFISLAST